MLQKRQPDTALAARACTLTCTELFLSNNNLCWIRFMQLCFWQYQLNFQFGLTQNLIYYENVSVSQLEITDLLK